MQPHDDAFFLLEADYGALQEDCLKERHSFSCDCESLFGQMDNRTIFNWHVFILNFVVFEELAILLKNAVCKVSHPFLQQGSLSFCF